jgi:hypothetical protein
MNLLALFLLISFSVFAGDIRLKDYDWNMSDIASRNLTKETLFTRMDRDFVKTRSSICSNRALLWANDFKQRFNLNTGKIFLFYTKKKSEQSHKTWWYHVAPVINEHEQLWVMDAGFSRWINKPLTKDEWLFKFSNSTRCKEINANETELINLMFREQTFPPFTSYGYFDCYYKIVPHTLWNPGAVAKNLLGKDEEGKPIRYERSEINKNELYEACLEATSTKIGWALGSSKKQCEEYVGL